MSTNNTATKAYTQRSGALWRTDDATPVTAVLIPIRQGHVTLVRVSGTYFNMTTGLSGGAFERLACFMYIVPGVNVSQVGTTTDVFSAGALGVTVTLDVSGGDARVRITGSAGALIAWQIAVEILEGGPNAANTGWTNG